MLTRNITVSFYIFRLLTYDTIFGKNLEHDTYGVKSAPHFAGGQYQAWSLKFMLVLLAMITYLKLKHIFG